MAISHEEGKEDQDDEDALFSGSKMTKADFIMA
jgi:hypothetical protein